jgi:hypothetical protein
LHAVRERHVQLRRFWTATRAGSRRIFSPALRAAKEALQTKTGAWALRGFMEMV